MSEMGQSRHFDCGVTLTKLRLSVPGQSRRFERRVTLTASLP